MSKQIKTVDWNNPVQVSQHVRDIFKGVSSALNEMEGTTLAGLPENLASEITALTAQMNASLAGLPPLTGVPAAMDASYALNSLNYVCNSISEMMAGLTDTMARLKSYCSEKATALNSLQGRVTAGELVEKTAAETEKQNAIVKALKDRATLLHTRRTAVIRASLPLPEDDVLTVEEAAFNAALKDAGTRLTDLKAKGFAETALSSALLFAAAPEYDRAIALAEGLKSKDATTIRREPLRGGDPAPVPAKGKFAFA